MPLKVGVQSLIEGVQRRVTRLLLQGTQRQFSENICSEDDLRPRIFETFAVVKFLACKPSPKGFEHLKNGIIAYL